MRKLTAALALLAMASCAPPTAYRVIDPITNEVLGRCYDGTFQAWCQVAQPEHTAVVAGSSLAGAAMTLAGAGIGTATVLHH
jgi:hypothetical protein